MDAQETGRRIEALLAELAAADPDSAGRAEELVRTLVEFYGCGLTRIVELLSADATAELAADPLVGSLLIVHDLHPESTEDRVRGALERVRPYLGSHSGDVHLVEIADDVVRLRLAGSCDGCPSSAVTVKLAIEQAIQEAAPEIGAIEVDGAVPEPRPATESGPGGRPLLPVVSTNGQDTRMAVDPGGTWVPVADAADTPVGALRGLLVAGTGAVVCNVGGTLYAYRDECPGCAAALASGTLSGSVLVCRACGRGFDLTRAGRGIDTHADAHLAPLPLLTGQDGVRVAVPAGAGR